MRCIEKNAQNNFYYKADDLNSGELVKFNIWNDSGAQLATDQLATSEINSQGVYYLTFNVPDYDGYLLVKGEITSGSGARGTVVKVGSPAQEKAFYIDKKFKSNLSLTYEVYDSVPTTLATGAMELIVSGFYYADVSGLVKPWFFEIYPYVSNDQICI